mmetsp:Transcript_8183/g.16340  ORF Transcript_8183/g.16340 Transcript_8183/m.16340 type:complete len:231 (-) Transcript_8183:143-835(-)
MSFVDRFRWYRTYSIKGHTICCRPLACRYLRRRCSSVIDSLFSNRDSISDLTCSKITTICAGVIKGLEFDGSFQEALEWRKKGGSWNKSRCTSTIRTKGSALSSVGSWLKRSDGCKAGGTMKALQSTVSSLNSSIGFRSCLSKERRRLCSLWQSVCRNTRPKRWLQLGAKRCTALRVFSIGSCAPEMNEGRQPLAREKGLQKVCLVSTGTRMTGNMTVRMSRMEVKMTRL